MTGRSGKQTSRGGSNPPRAAPAKSGSQQHLTPSSQAARTSSQQPLPPKSKIQFVKTKEHTKALKQKMLEAGLTAISKHDKHGFMEEDSSENEL